MYYQKSIFDEYVNKITNKKVREILDRCLESAPAYFWDMPASTTGKYHPSYALGDGGLIRHTLMVTYYADSLLDLEMFEGLAKYKSEILCATILHDVLKKGVSGKYFTAFDHPIEAANFVKNHAHQLTIDKNDGQYEALGKFIADMIYSHMGQWNTNKFSRVVLPKPETQLQKFVHMCDYIASRKGDKNVISYLESTRD